jgi:hypothetical protein
LFNTDHNLDIRALLEGLDTHLLLTRLQIPPEINKPEPVLEKHSSKKGEHRNPLDE